MTDQAKLIEDLRTYPWGVDDTPEGPRLLKRAADLLASKDGEIATLTRLEKTADDLAWHNAAKLQSAAALTLSLRAENERLRGAIDDALSNVTELTDKRGSSEGFKLADVGPGSYQALEAALSQSTGDTK